MSYKNISELKDKHKGEDIWVIAAGSSMDYVDESFFSNKIVIGQNQTYKKYPCDYIVMKDCNEKPRFPRSIEKLDEFHVALSLFAAITSWSFMLTFTLAIVAINFVKQLTKLINKI